MNLNDLFWDDLLLYLEQKQVIPIIGQDLLSVEVEGRSVNATGGGRSPYQFWTPRQFGLGGRAR
jgi:hypothetical protein